MKTIFQTITNRTDGSRVLELAEKTVFVFI